MFRVLIIQSEMKHYRLPFFSGLSEALKTEGVDLRVVYSNTHQLHSLLNDRADLAPPLGRKVPGRWLFNRLLYQSVWSEIWRADLVIVGPEIKYLINPLLLIASAVKLKTVAFWGLGPNRFPTRSPLAEAIKRPFFTAVDWWFAYTPSIARYLMEEGMPSDQITSVNNATDTTRFRGLVESISAHEVVKRKVELTGNAESRIGLYCGSLSTIKDIPFLVESMRLVHQQCPDFHLVVVGDGPKAAWVEEAAKDAPWIHPVGFKSGRDSALYYKMAELFAVGGTAGLAIVDCFAAALPLFVTDLPTHPPEISYVTDGCNGRIVPHDSASFANAVVQFLFDPELSQRLRLGAKASGAIFTMEGMIQNFKVGVLQCLARYSAGEVIDAPPLQRPGLPQ